MLCALRAKCLELGSLLFICAALWFPAQAQNPYFFVPGTPPGGVGAACLSSFTGYGVPVTGGAQAVVCDPSTHLWTALGVSGGGTCAALAGDVTGTCAAASVVKINGTSLAGLATGILKNTTTSGVPSIAVAGSDYAAANASTTVNGQACALGSTCNVNAGASANTLGVNGGAGAAITGLLLSAHQVPVGVAGVPTAKTITDCTDSAGQHLNYTQSTDTFSCGTSNGAATAVWTTFTTQTSVTLTHNLGTKNLFINCWDNSDIAIGFGVSQTNTNVMVFTFTNAQSGYCGATTGGNGSGGGGGGSVNSVTATAPLASSGGANPNITVAAFTGDSGSGGAAGAVPAPGAGDAAANKVLGAGGTWVAQTSGTSTVLIVTGHGNHTSNAAISTEFFSSCDATGGNVTLTLPASPTTGELHNIKRKDGSGNLCVIDGNGKTIDGGASVPMASQYLGISVYYDGTQWWVI